jgi:hypothetical protein
MLLIIGFLTSASLAYAYTLSSASCVGDKALLNATTIKSLGSLFGDTATFPILSPCNFACVRNTRLNRDSPDTLQSVRIFSPKIDRKECRCKRTVMKMKLDSTTFFVPNLGAFNVTEFKDVGLSIDLKIAGISSVKCTFLYPVDDQATIPVPVKVSGVWDQASKTVNAASSIFQTCGKDKSCILNNLSMELSPGLWRISALAGILITVLTLFKFYPATRTHNTHSASTIRQTFVRFRTPAPLHAQALATAIFTRLHPCEF